MGDNSEKRFKIERENNAAKRNEKNKTKRCRHFEVDEFTSDVEEVEHSEDILVGFVE